MHQLSDYDYDLPEELIAQRPCKWRDRSRLLVIERRSGRLEDTTFHRLPHFLAPGDLLVLNDTKVVPARILGKRATGGAVEVLLLGPDEKNPGAYKALIKPLARLKQGEKILLGKGLCCRLLDARNRIIDFDGIPASEVMRKAGVLPLPPYIRRPAGKEDRERYQTVFARSSGAVAAPTAGLHFTKKLFGELEKKGVRSVFLTLHVGYGTFSPVRSSDIREHRMHEENFFIPSSTIEAIIKARKRGGRVIAVGTTAAKALEDAVDSMKAPYKDINRESGLFIYPPYKFKAIDALITNFHLPRTSLLMLVSAFAGHDLIMKAYRHAVDMQYRFYSYGDAMLIL